MKKSALISIAKYAFAAGILAYLFLTDSLKVGLLYQALREHAELVLASTLIFFGVLNLGVTRWIILSRAQDIHLSYPDALRLTLIGHFWNLAVPGAVGGDVVKAYYVASSVPRRKHEAFTAVALDRVIGLFGLFVLASGAILLSFPTVTANPSMRTLAFFILGVLGTVSLGATAILSRRVRRVLPLESLLRRLPLGAHFARIAEALFVYRSHLPALAFSLVISVACHASLVVMIILCTRATVPDASVKLSTFYVIGPVGLFANAVPVTPGGLGVGETAFQELMKTGTDGRVTAGGNIFLLWRACAYVWMIPGLYFYVRGKGRIQRALARGEEDVTAVGHA